MPRTPTDRPPTLPGEVLIHEFIEPMGLSQTGVADSIGVSFQRLNGVVNGRRDLTTSTALRLARYFGTTPEFWINLQRSVDLYKAMREEGSEIESIEPSPQRLNLGDEAGEGLTFHPTVTPLL